MSNIVLHAEHLGKRYRIGVTRQRPASGLPLLRHLVAAPFEYLRQKSLPLTDENSIWAINNISFDVQRGEAVGVIGRNGVGKSTLLRILSRITKPTTGSAVINGRVVSLLEVGTGFHPELTGRENIYLNGAILGMKKREVDRRFDEIVAFAEVENFIETPVKHYSSGMYVRLAFAVAAHLETEILLVDEVLAVGDLQFQKKCLGKMGDIANEGRTVLFVSHNMQAIKTFCSRTLLIENGQLEADGRTEDVLYTYLTKNSTLKGDGTIPEDTPRPVGTGEMLVQKVAIKTERGNKVNQLFFAQKFFVEVCCNVKEPIADAAIEIGISTFDGLRIATVTSIDRGQPLLHFLPGEWKITVEIALTLLPGQYAVDLMIHHWGEERRLTIDWVERALTFTALDMPEAGSDHYVYFTRTYNLSHVRGFVRPEAVWQVPLQIQPLADSGI